MKESTTISKTAGCFIELIHRKSNPTVWIVRRWNEDRWFKKFVSSDWFIDGHQALSFAERMKRDFDRVQGFDSAKELRQDLNGHPGDREAVMQSEAPGSSVQSFVEGLHRSERLPDTQ